ncbi:SLP adapter and CSK-interacting membrane protein-like [Brienomyrus brachyistius]|uniref:SLP adapter and CSK-interacting membrane protein-like n=1 Tax=Brienomyrus brachyistius TaxID=42636 RepID=UPI0020B1B4CD|nr:SLP adapter and CSK-interacting membrane protein-like [Brienomyrus brachyistius]
MPAFDHLRPFYWLFLVAGMLLVSLIIGCIFLCINKYISRKAKEYKPNFPQNSTPQFYTQNSKYHPHHIEEDLPPLPPRNINLQPSFPSYEEISVPPDYIKVVEETPPPPPYQHQEPVERVKERPASDGASMDSYDDVVAPGYVSEDYDDVE